MPKVSIIIPCYNAGEYIEETIASVKSQDYEDYEVVIVDDGSEDPHTIEILNKLSGDKIKIIHQENGGPGVARNAGVANSTGEFIVMLDSDNKIRKNTLQKVLPVFDHYPEVGVVYGNYEYFGLKSGIQIQDDFSLRKQFAANEVELASVIRRKTFQATPGFDEFTSKHGFIEDYEFWFSVYRTGWKFKYINETLFDYRVKSISRTTEKQHEKEMALEHIYKKHSDLLHKEYLKLNGDYKNVTRTIDYRLGHMILLPFRKIKNFLRSRHP
jgi:glycosyltransferase involved in cell wall biosynthesis